MVGIEASLESARNVYRVLGVVALLSAAIYLALYHLLLAPRCASPVQHPSNNLLQGIVQFVTYNVSYRTCSFFLRWLSVFVPKLA